MKRMSILSFTYGPRAVTCLSVELTQLSLPSPPKSQSKQYFNCQAVLRDGNLAVDAEDGFYEEDAFEWLINAFKPLITELLSRHPQPVATHQATLCQYFSPKPNFSAPSKL